ncbi:uncharacterized protein LOC141855645 isoform X2 [Brevipalpus obovatus]|uniref:uncharacterized protein LOC141855645 isoform X2 n=1 Tax=Brevipalpus obovatus TaxID=246614 RepID=UPI003D9E17AD
MFPYTSDHANRISWSTQSPSDTMTFLTGYGGSVGASNTSGSTGIGSTVNDGSGLVNTGVGGNGQQHQHQHQQHQQHQHQHQHQHSHQHQHQHQQQQQQQQHGLGSSGASGHPHLATTGGHHQQQSAMAPAYMDIFSYDNFGSLFSTGGGGVPNHQYNHHHQQIGQQLTPGNPYYYSAGDTGGYGNTTSQHFNNSAASGVLKHVDTGMAALNLNHMKTSVDHFPTSVQKAVGSNAYANPNNSVVGVMMNANSVGMSPAIAASGTASVGGMDHSLTNSSSLPGGSLPVNPAGPPATGSPFESSIPSTGSVNSGGKRVEIVNSNPSMNSSDVRSSGVVGQAKKPSWASVASQPAKPQPKSLKSKMAAPTVLSSTKHLPVPATSPSTVTTSIDAIGTWESKNGAGNGPTSKSSPGSSAMQTTSSNSTVSGRFTGSENRQSSSHQNQPHQQHQQHQNPHPDERHGNTVNVSGGGTNLGGNQSQANHHPHDSMMPNNWSSQTSGGGGSGRNRNHNSGNSGSSYVPNSSMVNSSNARHGMSNSSANHHQRGGHSSGSHATGGHGHSSHHQQHSGYHGPQSYQGSGSRGHSSTSEGKLSRSDQGEGSHHHRRDDSRYGHHQQSGGYHQQHSYQPSHYHQSHHSHHQHQQHPSSSSGYGSHSEQGQMSNVSHTSVNAAPAITAPSPTAVVPLDPSGPSFPSHPILDKLRFENNYNPKEYDLSPPNARFFIIKSYSEDDIHRSIKYSIWCSTEHGNKRLDNAFKSQEGKGNVYLLFSVNSSGHFCGMAQMVSGVDYNSTSSVWAQDKWKGQFKVKWVYVKDVPNAQLRHIRLENNENKPVTNSRDTQEVPYEKGKAVLKIIHNYRHTTSIFDDFLHYERRQEEEHQRRFTGNQSTGSAGEASSGTEKDSSDSAFFSAPAFP